ncbi:hypothetical protein ASE28_08560 [Acidovorax sp. Root219]|nr:hypothetical protein ASE28_08560 [Acidovorax sp. Root219]
MLQLVAKNQRDAAQEAELNFLQLQGMQTANALEWRLIGERTRNGRVPMGLLAKLADPLNKLLLKAAFFARTNENPNRGVGDPFIREMNLKLAGLAEGSARLFIVGNTSPDATGSAPLAEGIDHLFDTLQMGGNPVGFYESLADLGERASEELHDVLKAIEQEECSVEVKWHAADEVKSRELRFDEVVRMRALLEDSVDPEPVDCRVDGLIGLLASSGRIQIVQSSGERINVKFRPKTQGDWVARLRLGQQVSLATKAKSYRDPASGEVTQVHRLVDTDL